MITKLKNFILTTFSRAPARGSMIVVWTFAAIVVFEIALYNAGWIYSWRVTHKPDMPELRLFLVTVICGGMASVCGFIGKGFVDRNKNGIPDEWEQKERDEK